MNLVSDRLNNMSPSATLAMSAKSAELKAQGVDVINLSVGETDFFTPTTVKEASKAAIDGNVSFYSPVPGFLSLRKAISDKLKRENDVEFAPEQIVCSNGAKQSVCNAILCMVNKGDEVIIPAPYWVSYEQMVILADGISVIVPTTMESGFKMTAAQLEGAITPKTKALILCSPSNPTGAVYSKDELQELAQVLAKYPNITVLSDEIYEHINYVGKTASIAQFSDMKDRVAIVNGVSKAYAMTGYRLGFLAAPLWLAKACNKLQGQYTSGPCNIAQKAAEEAYVGDQTPVLEMAKAFTKRRNLVMELVEDVPGLELNAPEGAFYAFPRCSSYFGKKTPDGTVIKDSMDFAMYLLNTAHVAGVAGKDFGDDNYIRLSYACSEDTLKEAFRRIREALSQLS